MHAEAAILRSRIYKNMARNSGLHKPYWPLSSLLLLARVEQSLEALTLATVLGDGFIPYLLYVFMPSALDIAPCTLTNTQDLFTIGACANSYFFRRARLTGGQSSRDDDYTFSLPIELLGTLGWAGVVVGLAWEGTHPLYRGEFDRIAVVLAVMSSLEL